MLLRECYVANAGFEFDMLNIVGSTCLSVKAFISIYHLILKTFHYNFNSDLNIILTIYIFMIAQNTLGAPFFGPSTFQYLF